ncbi:MAG: hypothetical protein HGA78_00110 [Nitrospirales bacterium]|nr:hypothetical protein [Nitrospirales bacterium]
MELWRRLLLLISVCTGIFLFFYASLSPLVIATPVDLAEKQKKEGTYRGVGLPDEKSESLARLPLQEYIAETTKGRLFRVEGPEWEDLFEAARAVDEGRPVAQEWESRLPAGQYPMKVLFFRPDEPPVNRYSPHLHQNNDEIYISPAGVAGSSFLRLKYRVYKDEDFHPGSGFSAYPHPPASMVYPFRKHCLGLIVFGLALYILLPWPETDHRAIRYARGRIILGDILSFVIIAPFFALPFLVTGGTLQAFTQGWPLLFFFWPLFFLGIWLLVIAAWFSGFSITVTGDRLKISTYNKGKRAFYYKDMESFQPVVFKPPRWLIGLSWLAALSGKGSTRIGRAGRAMILSSSASGSLCIRMKNDTEIFITVTDMMGDRMIKGLRALVNQMKKHGVKERTDVRVIRSLGLETMRLPKG